MTAFPPYCSRDGCADKHNEDNELTLHRAALLLFTGKQATSVCTSCLTTAYSSIKTNTSNKNSLLIYHRGPHSCKRIHFAMYRFNCVLRPTNFSQSGSNLLTAVAGRSQFNGWNHYLQSYHNWSLACQNLTLSALSITTVFPEISWLKSGLSRSYTMFMYHVRWVEACQMQPATYLALKHCIKHLPTAVISFKMWGVRLNLCKSHKMTCGSPIQIQSRRRFSFSATYLKRRVRI